MTGSPLLDLGLAMALFYFALCMVCSSANDGVARVLKWRAATLRDGIRSLLLNATRKRPDGREVELLDLFFSHPFVQSLRLQAELGDTWISRRLDGLTARLAGAWRALTGSASPAPGQPQLDPKTKLTFIPNSVFVQTLCEVLKQNTGSNEPLTFAALWRAIDQLPDETAGPLKVVLKSIANDPGQSLDAVQAKLGRWFDDGMEQATVWYRHKMRTASIVIGAVMVFGLNIDSIDVANRFYRDADLRARYAAAGRQAAGTDAVPTVDPIKDLTLGWDKADPIAIGQELQREHKLWNKLAGLILTVVAIGMGASFWHDVLTRLVGKKDGERKPSTP